MVLDARVAAKEREAYDDLAAGRATTFKGDDEFLGALEVDVKPLDAESWRPRVLLPRLAGPDPQQQRQFLTALKFLSDLATPETGFHPGLRVKRMQGPRDIWEMSWAPDGRATFQYGAEVHPGQAHIIWRRVGTHSIFRRP